ncbi:Tyrosyl-DNA phosphodiesterase 2 [Armadillidium nasatum]|uniref:Tyrosyl-DNA phosphodiesterase 2 n=1 Tax=Armadillidium nasatum TaxID=96803 RepID=A0A5N5T071_9CRUS|nr:Tyrosyl-DNA phosphodiesterase 2 [Armadillidium nasatum]
MDKSDEESFENNLDSETCQKLVEEFTAVTNTDEALAQFYLQDHNWKLEPSLNAFYEAQNGTSDAVTSGRSENSADGDDVMVTFENLLTKVTMKPPDKFKFITWNLDGLDDHNLKRRTKAVIKIMETEQPDIIFFQEVIPATYSYLEDHLPQYMIVPGGLENYFVATLLKRTTVYFDGHFIEPFPNTLMGRNILFVDCHIGSLKLRLLNSHLESTQDGAEERKAQFRKALKILKAGSKEHTSIFAGDLNLRDKEAKEAQIPNDIYDLWESCGQRQECKFTWDTLRNTNKTINSKFKPRARYDRVYLHQSDPPSLKPLHFGLIGIQKVSGTQSFPSDHWGISVSFDIVNQRAVTSSPPPSHASDVNLHSVPSTSKTSAGESSFSVKCSDSLEDSVIEINSSDMQSSSSSLKRKLSIVELD